MTKTKARAPKKTVLMSLRQEVAALQEEIASLICYAFVLMALTILAVEGFD